MPSFGFISCGLEDVAAFVFVEKLADVADGFVRTNRLEAGQHPPYPAEMTPRSPFRYFKTSPEYPSCASAFWGPQSVGLDQGVGGFKELSHDSDNGDLRRFSGGAKVGVLRLEIGVEPHGGQGRHVECIA